MGRQVFLRFFRKEKKKKGESRKVLIVLHLISFFFFFFFPTMITGGILSSQPNPNVYFSSFSSPKPKPPSSSSPVSFPSRGIAAENETSFLAAIVTELATSSARIISRDCFLRKPSCHHDASSEFRTSAQKWIAEVACCWLERALIGALRPSNHGRGRGRCTTMQCVRSSKHELTFSVPM